MQLQVKGTVTGQPVSFAQPLTIHIPPRTGELAPMSSTDGESWHPLQPLFSGGLPEGQKAGYTRNPNGSFDISTTTSGFFALLPEVTPPPAPASLDGHFAHGQLVLSWPKSLAASGPAVFYQVTLHNKPLLAIPGQTTAAVGQVHHAGPSVFRVVATDAAGKKSPPSKPLVIVPTRRPAKLPKIIPQWAYDLSDWQEGGRVGTRPRAPKIVPDWYWRWQPWHAAPFRIRG